MRLRSFYRCLEPDFDCAGEPPFVFAATIRRLGRGILPHPIAGAIAFDLASMGPRLCSRGIWPTSRSAHDLFRAIGDINADLLDQVPGDNEEGRAFVSGETPAAESMAWTDGWRQQPLAQGGIVAPSDKSCNDKLSCRPPE